MNSVIYNDNNKMVALSSGKTSFDSMIQYSERKSSVGFDSKNKRWFAYDNDDNKVYVNSKK